LIALVLENSDETEMLGAALGRILPKRCTVFLHGDLGAGKTTLVRGLLRGAGYQSAVKSPTYSLVEEYRLAERTIFHFDLYRLKDPEELEWMGMDDYLRQDALCCIEWPQMGAGWLPAADIELWLCQAGDRRRAEIGVINDTLKNNLVLSWKNKDLLL
jgi:tRNA threonylcarbamoyladenosine biosynthesis protein TsaE